MPIYEYRCQSCDHEFETFVRTRDAEPEECPACDDPSIDRLISNTNFKLKGSGWYETDYARDDDDPGGASDSADASTADTEEASPDSEADAGQAA